jgi:DNA-binding LacI/PurR family transcriptional regulator
VAIDGQPRRRPTIHDVARHAGVSKSLVSLVLQGSPKVSEARRQSVLDAMAALDYQPNRLAQGLVARRSGIVGVIASDLHNPFFAALLDAVLQLMDGAGLRTLLGTGRRLPERERELVESLVALPVDGVLLLSPVIDSAELKRLSRRTPMVITGRSDMTAASIDTVVDDNVTGAGLVVKHLTSLGHRRIAHITGGDSPAAPERARGFRQAMTSAGLKRYMKIVPGDATDQAGYRAMRQVLASRSRPTAVFAANDYAALGALDAIEEAGLSVPDDISLVGYDNSSIGAFRRISLTSVDQPHTEMGRLAARVLCERINGSAGPPGHVVLMPRLITRATTAPPR